MTVTAIKELPNVVIKGELDFIWLELTSLCNMECVHCYAESGPNPETKNILSPQKYLEIITQAANMNCKKIQFISGEPTIVKHLPDYIVHASNNGFEFIEVFTNAFVLTKKLLTCFVENKVSVATSFYCDIP